jgi:glycolate oxidase FAD binding subunit
VAPDVNGPPNPAVTSGRVSRGIQELKSLGVNVRRAERPASEREARQILSRASQERLSVFPCGGATSPAAGVLPECVDIALDTTGMDRVLAFDPGNLNLAALAGITLDQINEYLAGQGKGFFLPLDPPLSRLATLGGVYASNASGPSRLRYGTVRDQVLGVRGADAGGREVGFGGKTVKNVSGYDLTKFFIGSAGSLCLITSLSLRVYPFPDASSLCDVIFRTFEELEKFLAALRCSVLVPSASVGTELAGGPGVSDSFGSRFRLLTSFEGHPRAVERQNKALLNLAGEFGGMGDAKEGRDGMRKALRSAVDPDGGREDSILKISVPISRGPRAYLEAGKLARSAGFKSKVILFAGTGVMYLYFQEGGQERITQLIQELKEIGHAAGGHVTPIRTHRDVLSGWGPRVEPALHRLILKPVKEKLDPSGVFPPILH